MTPDARFTCPQCGRAPMPPDFALLFPAMTRAMWDDQYVVWERQQAENGGRLKAGKEYTCISGHTWRVPTDTPTETWVDSTPAHLQLQLPEGEPTHWAV